MALLKRSPKTNGSPKPRRYFKNILAILVILVIAATAGYFSLNWWLADRVASPASTEQSSTTDRDETPISNDALANYQVAADQPRILHIEALNVKARILPMGVDSDNAMQAPVNIYDAGWYTGSAEPGQPGAMVIDGHASGKTRQGLFAYLDTLTSSDIIKIERGDGAMLNYQVVRVDTVPLDEVDMAKAMRPYGDAAEGITLITCTGQWLEDGQTYDHRVLVYAFRVP